MRLIIGLALLALFFTSGDIHAGAASPQEYEVKAAFIYNFAKFVDWPPDAFAQPGSPIVIGILGKDPFGPTIDRAVQGKSVNEHPFVVSRVRWGPELRECHILFVSASEKDRIGQMGEFLKGAPVLTIGESAGFAQRGGVIRFLLEENRVRFEINVEAARRAHLKISSKLLRLAKIV